MGTTLKFLVKTGFGVWSGTGLGEVGGDFPRKVFPENYRYESKVNIACREMLLPHSIPDNTRLDQFIKAMQVFAGAFSNFLLLW